MDGFDDLLAPSQQALEDNPFADPFAKQRISPDPWATPFSATDSHAFGNTSEHFSSLNSYSSSDNNEFGAASSSEFKPLDSHSPPQTAEDNDDDDDEPLGRMRSPGFRESIPATSLPLDGETVEGWRTETQTPWQPEHPVTTPTKITQSDEDSDDDKPIMQTLKNLDQNDTASVSAVQLQYRSPISDLFFFVDKTPQPTKAIRNDKGIQPVFMITVDDPQKVGDPIRSFTMYTVHTRVNAFI